MKPSDVITPPAVVAVAFSLRVAAGMLRNHGVSWWETGYSHYAVLAQNIARGEGFHLGALQAPRPPLYPLLLAAEYRLSGGGNLLPIVVQSAIGAGTVLIAFHLARLLFDRRTAVLAASFIAVYPYYVVHDSALQETGLFTFLTAGSIYALVRASRSSSLGDYVAAGFWIGLDVLCREVIAPFALLAVAWLWWYQRPIGKVAQLRVGLTLLVAVSVVVPWLARNAVVYGSPVLSAGGGFGLGYRMWVGHNDFTIVGYPWISIDESTPQAFGALSPSESAELEALNERDRDRWFMRRAVDFIARDPTRALKYELVKIFAAFSPVLSPTTGPWWRSAMYAASYTPMLLLAVAGAVVARARWRTLYLIYALVASFVMVVIMTHAHTSHRSYLDVYFAILASHAVLVGYSTALRLSTIMRPATAGVRR